MKARSLLSAILILGLSATAQRTISLPDVTAIARVPMNRIGLTETRIDSTALKENIALSMADVLAYNSGLFVKNHGRATLSTVSFRGTSPSHTAVSWNGMDINSPMLGSTDFSLIPAFFIDGATLLHGSSSVGSTGGGLGGAIELDTKPTDGDGLALQYVQGIGSFSTFDEYLRVAYGHDRWHLSTRAVVSTSPNDYTYRNRDKKENIYDENHQIIGQYYPKERNVSGAFRDLHLLQEAYYDAGRRGELSVKLWWAGTNRELPLLTTDYSDPSAFENRQRENTFRGVASWDLRGNPWSFKASAGYTYSRLAYDYRRDSGSGQLATMTRSRSTAHTIFASASARRLIGERLTLSADLKGHQYLVKSTDINPFAGTAGTDIFGYRKGRTHLTGSTTLRWRPTDRLGLQAIVREEFIADQLSPVIPALFVDYTLISRCNLRLKASGSRNYRYPTLNDLYFLPGGNPRLHYESGWSYDAGAEFTVGSPGRYALSGSATWFDSYIDNWIIWLPTTKGYFSPRNIRRVHAYGVELKADLTLSLGRGWQLGLDGSFSFTPSINQGERVSDADNSAGRQLPYVPRQSASVNGRLSWHGWTLHYKWLHYSQRFTQSSNEQTLTGHLPPYYMNSLSLERLFTWRPLDLSVKAAVNNLFNEEYLSVLSRPMPGINFELFFSFTPKF